MPTRYEYDRNLNIITTYQYGRLSIAEIVAHLQNILNDDEINTGFVEVINFDGVDDFLFSYTNAENVICAFNKMNDEKKLRGIIFVGKSYFHYAMARMLQILHEINKADDNVFVLRSAFLSRHMARQGF